MIELKPSGFHDAITVTDKEIEAIIGANEEEDAVGVENDLKALIDSKNKSSVPIQVHVRYTTPSPNIAIRITNNKDFWK